MGVRRRLQNRLDNARNILHHFVVPDSHHPESLLFQQAIASLVIPALRIVLSTINLDNQTHFKANKIHDELHERKLPAKTHTLQLPVSQDGPELSLRIGHRRSELARAFALDWRQPHTDLAMFPISTPTTPALPHQGGGSQFVASSRFSPPPQPSPIK